MIDFNDMAKYTENNRIEAKKAAGGLPHSIWETYSAFANTIGGIILLGVVEDAVKALQVTGIADPETMLREFWSYISDPQRVSANILSEQHVRIVDIDEKQIIVIEVPRADRHERPIYLNGSPYTESYRRDGEGDYHCTRDEVETMLRDQTDAPKDAVLLQDILIEALNSETVSCYRDAMTAREWSKLPDDALLQKIGAAGLTDRRMHPTAAGLLMFGTEPDIVSIFPSYRLIYREQNAEAQWEDCIISHSGNWSGNVFDFYLKACCHIDKAIQHAGDDGEEKNTLMCRSLHEAVANAVMHADYYGGDGVVIEKSLDALTVSNAGGLRLSLDAALSGQVSDPRNPTLTQLFAFAGIGKRSGSGLKSIHTVWEKYALEKPSLREQYHPDRTVFSIKTRERSKEALGVGAIIRYLTDHVQADAEELAERLRMRTEGVRVLLNHLAAEDLVVMQREGDRCVYLLKH